MNSVTKNSGYSGQHPKRYEPMKNKVIKGWKYYTKDRRKTVITKYFKSKGVSEIIHHFSVKLF